MCGTVKSNKWQKELPQEPGDWLWIEQWECGCVRRCGIADIYETTIEDEQALGKYSQYYYQTSVGHILGICWNGLQEPTSYQYDEKRIYGVM